MKLSTEQGYLITSRQLEQWKRTKKKKLVEQRQTFLFGALIKL